MAATLARLRKIIVEHLGVDADKVTETATFEGLGADSLDMVELVMAFEDEFGIEVPDEDSLKVVTVNDAIALIDRLVPAGPALPGGE